LGISIVGGRQDENDRKLQGIFIKHVLESSPAGQTGLLKTGDQILEVPPFVFLIIHVILAHYVALSLI